MALDLSDRHQLAQQVDSIIATYSSIEILVKNAGIYPPGQALEIDIDTVEDTLNVHMIGPWILSQQLIPLMIQAGYRRVVNVSSSGGGSFAEGLSPHHAAYGVSKVGLNALTFQLAQSVPRFVKVNAMCPGWVRTRMGGQSATRSPEQGADTAIWLATLPEEGVTGAFFAIANQLSGDSQKASIIIESQFIQSSFLRH